MTRELLHVWLMPWAEFPEIVHFGEIQIWDFYRIGPSMVSDSQEMLWLTQLMSSFRDRFGKQMRNVCVVQNGKFPFEMQNDEANEKIRWAGYAINFAYLLGSIISKLKRPRGFLTDGQSDRFQLVDVVIDSQGYVHYSEISRSGISNLNGMYYQYNEPPNLISKVDVPDRLLLKALAKINEEGRSTELWRQISICFEWFFTAWTSSPDVSIPARYISLMTCFESLSRICNTDKLPKMVSYASELCQWADFPNSENRQRKGSEKTDKLNKPSKFIYDFADYRNSFVHGDKLPWGRIKYKVPKLEIDPRHVMSLIIYCILANLLLKKGVFEDLERVLIEKNLKTIAEMLDWNSDQPMLSSPHLVFGSSIIQ